MENSEFYSIVERLAILEGRVTPTSVKKGLNTQQKSVPQLPALFKPRDIKVLGSKTDPKHPMSGYMVGDDVENDEEPLEDCMGYGTSMGEEKEVAEDVLDKVKKSLTDYLKNLEDEIRTDTDLKAKSTDSGDIKKKEKKDSALQVKKPMGEQMATEDTPVKTILLDNGRECGIYGNERDGFSIRHGARQMSTKFNQIDHAEMALEMYNARCRALGQQDDSADYIDEE
jgi:hypothetical protein